MEISTRFIKGDPRLIGNTYAKGNRPNRTSFKKGTHISIATEIKKGEHRSLHTEFKKGHKLTNEQRETLKRALLGNKHTLGLEHTAEWKQRHSLRMTGVNHPNWKGGVTSANARLAAKRRSGTKKWRQKILARDKYACTICGSNERLEVDHIKPISLFPDLALSLENGRTLCHECHKLTSTYGGKVKNYAHT